MPLRRNLYDAFAERARLQPAHAACVDLTRNERCSYADLLARIDTSAATLAEVGVAPGACIGLHVPSGLEYVVWAYAIWRCGGTIVPIAVELVTEEKAEVCRTIHLAGVITATADVAPFEDVRAGAPRLLRDAFSFVAVTSGAPPAGFGDVNAAFVRFTSGTTGASKGVVLSHESVYDRIHAANDVLALGPDDIVIWLLSMSYHFTVSIVAYLTFGATFVLCRDQLFARTLVKTAAAEKATFIYGSPQHCRLMASDTSGTMLPDLRMPVFTASALKQDTAESFRARFALAPVQAYGIIELGLPCINLDDRPEKLMSVGRTTPSFEVRLRDVGFGENLQAIEFRGKGMFDAYYSPWTSRDEVMPEGWFATGDLGMQDAEGFVYILGRSKEMISVGGMKFFPNEVESVLESHPAVKEAWVYAEPHARLGEIPHAQIVLRDGVTGAPAAEALRAHCLAHLTEFKVPDEFAFVPQLPRTASGKLLRRC